MPEEEKKKRMAALQSRIRREDIQWWWDKILENWIGVYLKEQFADLLPGTGEKAEPRLKGLEPLAEVV
jgi:hypothetical protein